jgi:chemotaxis protein MotB
VSGVRNGRNQGHEETDTEGSWAISYGDLLTVLLTFFILFFSTNKSVKQDQRVALQDQLVEKLKTKFTEPKLQFEKNATQNSIEEAQFDQWGGKVMRLGQKIVVEFPGTSFFDLGQTDVNPQAKAVLKKFVEVYLPYMGQNSLSVKAFTDTVQVSEGKRFHDNLELSALRAISAMRDLQALGIPLHLMRISGHGELQSIARRLASDSTPDGVGEGATQNDPLARKIVLVVEPTTEEKL